MKFVSLRDFRTRTLEIRKDLKTQHELVLTASGRPIAILAEVNEGSFEDRLKALRQARSRAMVEGIREKARARGVDKLTMEEIDAEVAAARRGRGAGG